MNQSLHCYYLTKNNAANIGNMLVKDLPFENLPQVQPSDKVYNVLNQMYEYHVESLPVVQDGKYAGIVKEEILLNEDADTLIDDIQTSFLKIYIRGDEHLLRAVALAATSRLHILPVVDEENNFAGVFETNRLLYYIADFMHLQEPGALIVLEIDSFQYSFSEISKIVETNDAQITQLNTSRDKESGKMQITIRINKVEVSDIVSTFQRYEYNVKYYFGEELYANELKDNYENLMNYLNI